MTLGASLVEVYNGRPLAEAFKPTGNSSTSSEHQTGAAQVIIVRPKVAELIFQLYGRALHPELFEVYQSRQVDEDDYQAKIEITSAGHVVTWRYGGLTLTEVATSAHFPLPERRRLFSHRLRGRRCDRVECRGRASYQTSFHLEVVDPAAFWAFHEDILWDDAPIGILHRFGSGGRIAMGAMSYIRVEPRRRTLRVQAFHTFPDDCAIVRSQTDFQLP